MTDAPFTGIVPALLTPFSPGGDAVEPHTIAQHLR